MVPVATRQGAEGEGTPKLQNSDGELKIFESDISLQFFVRGWESDVVPFSRFPCISTGVAFFFYSQSVFVQFLQSWAI